VSKNNKTYYKPVYDRGKELIFAPKHVKKIKESALHFIILHQVSCTVVHLCENIKDINKRTKYTKGDFSE
jgi:hypothetical protein